MIKLHVDKLRAHDKWEEFPGKFLRPDSFRWCQMVDVLLSYEDADGSMRSISDDFSLLVCSPSYAGNPPRNGIEPVPEYTLVERHVDLDGIRKEAERRVSLVQAEDWDSFHDQMRRLFLQDYGNA